MLSGSGEGNFKNNGAGASTPRGTHSNGKGSRRVGGRGRFPPTRTSGGTGASIPDIIDEICTSELVKQLHQIRDEFHGDGPQDGFGKAKVGFAVIKVLSQVFNPEGLKGSVVNEVKGGVGVKS